MFLEVRTLFVVYIVFNVLGVIMMASFWKYNRKRYPEIVLWLAGYIMQLVALPLIALRDVIPDLISVILANALIVGGTVVLYVGLERYVEIEIKRRQLHNYVMVAVFILIHACFTYIYPSLAFRIINLSFALLYISAQGAWLMLYRAEPDLRPAARATGIVLAAFCIISVVQIIENLTGSQASHLFKPGLMGALTILANQMLFIGLTFGLFLLVSRRLLLALENELVEHKLTEYMLLENKQQFQGLIETLYDWVWEVDSNGKYTYVSPQIKNILGYEPEEILGKTPYELMPLEEAARVSEVFTALIREGKPITALENTNIHKDGHTVIIETNGRPFYDAGGKFKGYRGTDRDITVRKEAGETLKKSEEQVRLLLNSAAEAIYGIDMNGNCTFANPSCLKILGYADMEQLLGRNMHQLIHYSYPDGRPMRVEDCRIYQAFREGKRVHVDDEVLWKADGTCFSAEYWSYPQEIDGKVIGAVVAFVDITERMQTAELLVAERQRLAYILEGTNAGTWEWNVQTGETVFNERWAEMIGYTLAELAPANIDTWMKFTHSDDLARSQDLLERHFRKELPYYECEARMRHRDGRWIWVLDRGKVVTWTDDGKPLNMYGTHQEITSRKLAEEQIHHMATHDMLTGLPSLRLAKDRLSVALSMSRRYKKMTAVMFIDLDGFKKVNDTMGHDAGDYVLKLVAERMLSCVRESDTVARVGGDEFLLISSELYSKDDAARIAEKLIGLVSQPIVLIRQQTAVGASIGIALYPENGEDMDQLIKQADEAMYRVKNAGKNGFAFANTQAK